MDSSFGAGSSTQIFKWEGTVGGSDRPGGKVPEHYIVLIAPNSSDDLDLQSFREDLFTFEHGILLYEGSQEKITSRSYAVLKVARDPGYDIMRELYNSLDEPWAVLGRESFLGFNSSVATSAEEIKGLADDALKSLKTEVNLLLAERRFSKHDRAVAAKSMGTLVLNSLRNRAKTLKLGDVEPQIYGLTEFVERLGIVFLLDPADIETGAAESAITVLDELEVTTATELDQLLQQLRHEFLVGADGDPGAMGVPEGASALAFQVGPALLQQALDAREAVSQQPIEPLDLSNLAEIFQATK